MDSLVIQRLAILLVLIVVNLIGYSSADADSDSGPNLHPCEICTQSGTFQGWCYSEESCLKGTKDGPIGRTCSDWRWQGGPCATPCKLCTSSGTAQGWCFSEGYCAAGNATLPFGRNCSDWRWQGNDCEPDRTRETIIVASVFGGLALLACLICSGLLWGCWALCPTVFCGFLPRGSKKPCTVELPAVVGSDQAACVTCVEPANQNPALSQKPGISAPSWNPYTGDDAMKQWVLAAASKPSLETNQVTSTTKLPPVAGSDGSDQPMVGFHQSPTCGAPPNLNPALAEKPGISAPSWNPYTGDDAMKQWVLAAASKPSLETNQATSSTIPSCEVVVPASRFDSKSNPNVAQPLAASQTSIASFGRTPATTSSSSSQPSLPPKSEWQWAGEPITPHGLAPSSGCCRAHPCLDDGATSQTNPSRLLSDLDDELIAPSDVGSGRFCPSMVAASTMSVGDIQFRRSSAASSVASESRLLTSAGSRAFDLVSLPGTVAEP